MISRIIGYAFACLLVQAPLCGQNRSVKLNGGLEAEVLTIGRSANHLGVTVIVEISNRGKTAAYIMLLGTPVVTDNSGGGFRQLRDVSGIAHCGPFINGYPDSVCYGSPRIIEDQTVPLQAFTLIEPNVSITINLRFDTGNSYGPLISLSANLAYRLVNDTGKDATLPDAEKYKQFRMMTLSFPLTSVTDAKQ